MIPVALPMETIAILLVLQVPPVVASLTTAVPLWHTEVAPVIGTGVELIFTVAVRVQPDSIEYVIVVDPAAIPATIPVEPIEPTDGLLLLHVPPAEASLKLVEEPTHALSVPLIGRMALTVTAAVI